MPPTKQKIISVLPEGRFCAQDIAELLGVETISKNGFNQLAPSITRQLLALCKEGLLYQWIIGTGGGLDGISYNSHKWELYYLKRDCELAKTLLQNRSKYLNGYRFK